MKSQVNALLHVLTGLFKDVQSVYPALKGLELDLENLHFQSRTRGLAFFTLDLPSLDACLLHGLDVGRLQLQGPLSRRVSRGVKVPRFLSGLWLRVFDENAILKQDVDINAIFFIRCITTLGKRIVVDCAPDRIKATMENYHDIERRLRSPTFRWELDNLDIGPDPIAASLADCCGIGPESLPLFAREGKAETQEEKSDRYLLGKIQRVADLLVNAMDEFSPLSLSGKMEEDGHGIGFRHGRGAVAEKLKNWEKSQFPNWPSKLESTFPWGLCGSTAGSPLVRPSHHEVASRLMCVPKTAKSPRLIAAEPTSHMWCQQLILNWFEDQFSTLFEGHFIDLKSQWKSGQMVIQASLDRKHATVDLSDASDRVTCWTVERIFRAKPSLLTALHAARTRYIRDTISAVPSFLKTKKFASQGTATTFPVMSFTMLCIALGSSISGEVTWCKISRLRRHVRVYGDDIVIPTHGYTRLVRAMELLQLKVNTAKSYVTGYFRESCGVDGYLGHDVTPVRPKTLVADSPESCGAVVDTTNNLFNKGLWNAARSLEDLLPRRTSCALRVVGPDDSGVRGLCSFVGTREDHLRRRWNLRYQRHEVLVWDNRSQHKSKDREGYSALLDFFAQQYDPGRPRVVSRYAENRKSHGRLVWEPRYSEVSRRTRLDFGIPSTDQYRDGSSNSRCTDRTWSHYVST